MSETETMRIRFSTALVLCVFYQQAERIYCHYDLPIDSNEVPAALLAGAVVVALIYAARRWIDRCPEKAPAP